MSKSRRYSREIRERAVRMVFEHEKDYESRRAAPVSISGRTGCTPETPGSRVKRTGIDTGRRDGVTSDDEDRLKALARENRELKRANEILKTASVFFARAELDRRLK